MGIFGLGAFGGGLGTLFLMVVDGADILGEFDVKMAKESWVLM